jgi:hypothetical protein
MFYEPLNISLDKWNTTIENWTMGSGAGSGTTTKFGGAGKHITTVTVPDGNGYSTIVFNYFGTGTKATWNITSGSTATRIKAGYGGTAADFGINATGPTAGPWGTVNVGKLYNKITGAGANHTLIRLLSPADATTHIEEPAIIIFEEEDDNNEYQAIVIDMEGKGTDSDGVGVSDAITTYTVGPANNDTAGYTYGSSSDWDNLDMESVDATYASMDLWGTLMMRDDDDSDQSSMVITYPDIQAEAVVYVAAEDASITSSSSSSAAVQLGDILVKDSEVSSVATKNLIVVGGSCINSAAASLIGEPACGADFTTATGVGSGQFLIKSYASSDLTSKMALLVAGYDAADTVNAAKYLRTQTVDTSSEYKGTSATSAELVVA